LLLQSSSINIEVVILTGVPALGAFDRTLSVREFPARIAAAREENLPLFSLVPTRLSSELHISGVKGAGEADCKGGRKKAVILIWWESRMSYGRNVKCTQRRVRDDAPIEKT
jgi:hypothetical protein